MPRGKFSATIALLGRSTEAKLERVSEREREKGRGDRGKRERV